MTREIFEVYAKVVDSNGAYNTLTGYPKSYDSRSYSDDIDRTRQRAYAEYHECLGAMYKRDDRQLQLVMLIQASTGLVMESTRIGRIADLPDPEPAPEEPDNQEET